MDTLIERYQALGLRIETSVMHRNQIASELNWCFTDLVLIKTHGKVPLLDYLRVIANAVYNLKGGKHCKQWYKKYDKLSSLINAEQAFLNTLILEELYSWFMSIFLHKQ